jgi:type I restriction enzyme, S subunit
MTEQNQNNLAHPVKPENLVEDEKPMSEWKEIEFANILIDESISYGIVQPGSHSEINSVPVLRVNNIKNGNIIIDDVLKVDSAIENKYKRTRLTGGELLITVVGSIGECAIVPIQFKGWNVARAVSVARIKEEYDKRFIKYAFKTNDIVFQMYGNTNDTVQPTLNLSSLKSLKFLIPPLPEQRTIASILSSLDDKIDLLHRQNQTLEKMAETLFRQWFVEEAKEDWEERQLKDVVDIGIGRTPPRQEFHWFSKNSFDVKWISIKDLGNDGAFIFNTSEYLTKEAVERFNIPVIPKNTVVLSFKMTVGRVAITTSEMLSNEAIAHFKFNKNTPFSKEYLYLFLKTFKYDSLGSTSSIVTSINSAMIKELEITIPDFHTINEFKERTEPIFNKIKQNQTQIRTLSTLRDILLPKLMSGEVRVKI